MQGVNGFEAIMDRSVLASKLAPQVARPAVVPLRFEATAVLSNVV